MSSLTIYKRELTSYFSQPTAYAIIVIFLLLSMGLTFSFGNFMRVGDASLEWTFFFWHPWILHAARTRRRHETLGRRTTHRHHRTARNLPALHLERHHRQVPRRRHRLARSPCCSPSRIVITVNYLGDPDNGAILSGYIGSFLVCCTFLAITMLVSACTRDQVVCLIVSVAICVTMVLCGYDRLHPRAWQKPSRPACVEAIISFGVWDHFRSLNRGLFRLQDFIWFGSFIFVCLLGTSAILSAKRA